MFSACCDTLSGLASIGDIVGEGGCGHPLVLWPPDRPLAESPGPVVDGVAIGILPAESTAQLGPWLRSLRITRPHAQFMATMAMGVSPFLEQSDEIRGSLKAAFPELEVHNWQADVFDREELAAALASGPELALYVGHARTGCWSGYQVIKWPTITREKGRVPIGTLLHFACSTMAGKRSAESFGARWVLSGRALSSFGATGAIKISDLCDLAGLFLSVMRTEKPDNIGEWLVMVDAELRQSRELAHLMETFSKFRLLGAARPFISGSCVRTFQ